MSRSYRFAVYAIILVAGFGAFWLIPHHSQASRIWPTKHERDLQTLSREKARAEALEERYVDIRESTIAKERVISDLVAGKIGIYAAIDQFRDLMTDRPKASMFFHPDLSSEETAYYLVLHWTIRRLEGTNDQKAERIAQICEQR